MVFPFLFDDGYLPGEFGMYALPDGGTMIANLTDMPGVTPEMFDWWFAWHGLDSFRYTIWDKDDHYYCQSLSVEQNLEPRGSLLLPAPQSGKGPGQIPLHEGALLEYHP